MKFTTFGLNKTSTELNPEITVSSTLVGGKGAGLVWMSHQGIPVPPGFIIPTTVWAEYDKKPLGTMKAIGKSLTDYLKQLKAHFGYMPLLAVRSGARVSCPGMMDTILNVGLDGSNLAEWKDRIGKECTTDSLSRLVTMYGSVVKGIPREELIGSLSAKLALYKLKTGEDLPDMLTQVLESIEAVFKSWDNERAIVYRKMHNIPREWGTAVVIQAMVFGNLNDDSASGVLFTRNPDTGAKQVTGEYLVNAQGEDIVAGIRTPLNLTTMSEWHVDRHADVMEMAFKLEALKKDVQDIEFTIQDGTLYILQTRTAKRSASAALRITMDLVNEGVITKDELPSRVSVRQYDTAQLPTIHPDFMGGHDLLGIGACSGVVKGKPVFSKEEALESEGPCILITQETTPDDIAGMAKARGVITMVGGLTSHAAVVARSMDRACIVGVGQSVGVFKGYSEVTMDGATGRIWLMAAPIVGGEANALVAEFDNFLANTFNIVPVIFATPKRKMGRVLFVPGAKILNPIALVQEIQDTLAQVDEVFIDMHPSRMTEEQREIVSLAGNVGDLLTTVYLKLAALESEKIVLVGTAFGSLRSIEDISDLRALVLAPFGGVLSNPMDPAIQKIVEWKKKDGPFDVFSLGKMADTTSMMSVPSLLHALAAAG